MKTNLTLFFLSLFLAGHLCCSAQFTNLILQDDQIHEDPTKAYGWNWLYTGVWGAGSNTNIGLDGAGVWYAAIILNLSGHIGDSITKIGYYHGDSATVTAKIYTGNYQNPLILVGESDPYTYTTAGWKQNIMLQTPVAISSPGLYWIVLAVQDPGANYYPLGARTPLNTNAGKISLDGNSWSDLSTYSLDFSWLIGAYVYSVCPPPKNLNATNVGPYSATVSWASQGGIPTSWEIQYGPTGFTPGSGQTATSTLPSTTLTSLSHSTQYDFYVRAVCGSSDISPWAGPGSFETEYVNDHADFLTYYFGFGGENDNILYPTINVTIPGSPDLSNLAAYFTVSPGVLEVKAGGIDQISGITPNNFYTPVLYSILAEDSITIKNWLVIVNNYNSVYELNESNIFLYPNPCNSHTTLYCPDASVIMIFDISGKQLFRQISSSPMTTIETNKLSQGVYILKVHTPDKEFATKLIVQ